MTAYAADRLWTQSARPAELALPAIDRGLARGEAERPLAPPHLPPRARCSRAPQDRGTRAQSWDRPSEVWGSSSSARSCSKLVQPYRRFLKWANGGGFSDDEGVILLTSSGGPYPYCARPL